MEESLHPRLKSASHRCLGLFWTLNSIPLVSISVLMPAPTFWFSLALESEVWVFQLFHSILSWLFRALAVLYEFEDQLFHFRKKHHWNLIGIALNLSTTLGNPCLLNNIKSFQPLNLGCLSPWLCLLSILPARFCSSHCVSLSSPEFVPKYFMLLMLLQMEMFSQFSFWIVHC